MDDPSEPDNTEEPLMATDLLEQLTAAQVPPVAADLDRGIHHRVNNRLLASHLADFVLQAIPYCFAEFARAVAAVARTTAGQTPTPPRGPRRHDP